MISLNKVVMWIISPASRPYVLLAVGLIARLEEIPPRGSRRSNRGRRMATAQGPPHKAAVPSFVCDTQLCIST